MTDLHERVRNEDDVHPVEDGGNDRVPQSGLTLEVLKRAFTLVSLS